MLVRPLAVGTVSWFADWSITRHPSNGSSTSIRQAHIRDISRKHNKPHKALDCSTVRQIVTTFGQTTLLSSGFSSSSVTNQSRLASPNRHGIDFQKRRAKFEAIGVGNPFLLVGRHRSNKGWAAHRKLLPTEDFNTETHSNSSSAAAWRRAEGCCWNPSACRLAWASFSGQSYSTNWERNQQEWVNGWTSNGTEGVTRST